MRAEGRDIVEQFGFAPDDTSGKSLEYFGNKECPFRGGTCTKFNHDKSVIYGVCSVTNGNDKRNGSEVIICPKRLYSNSFQTLQDAAKVAWPTEGMDFISDGSMESLFQKAVGVGWPVIAFGQGSGNEISTNSSNGKLSMDWVIQRYSNKSGTLEPIDFIGIEVQSIDITNNWTSQISLDSL
jgi:hypothetical protein